MALICACHAFGWPVARGGSRSITDALAAVLREHGGDDRDRRRGESLAELPRRRRRRARPRARGASPRSPATGCPRGSRAPTAATGTGPGAFKVDLAVEGGVPWTNEACRRAGTVHAAGSFEEIVAAEREVNRGRMPERPFVLVGQQYLADPTRSAGDVHPVWAYAHVPERLRRRRDRGADRPDRALRARAARADRGERGPLAGRVRRLQPQLRRRRHHHGRTRRSRC